MRIRRIGWWGADSDKEHTAREPRSSCFTISFQHENPVRIRPCRRATRRMRPELIVACPGHRSANNRTGIAPLQPNRAQISSEWGTHCTLPGQWPFATIQMTAYIQAREGDNQMAEQETTGIGWFIAGLGLGALLGVLFAPKAGRSCEKV